jgi:hypothetical protein
MDASNITEPTIDPATIDQVAENECEFAPGEGYNLHIHLLALCVARCKLYRNALAHYLPKAYVQW